ncbi:hypothetical protein LOTGIDRAFT_219893 [Lottia gigantea]|uniref:Phospholipid/glycerol acyltransferase domain-containing protein n=1 Tax=Lottia gigantea TaxID=225164 RepID=V3ZYJ1_LOTGI|nr:hypothetical protein LOTGIDRAFT_219893 [Lottia gigantea]ESO87710.1 hypothetical protein LOTGIDRAFT_219893 [Lottia gigantea]
MLREIIRGVLRLTIFIATNFYTIPSFLVWFILLQPLRVLAPDVFWRLDAILFKGLIAMVATWHYTGGYRVIEAGDDLSSLENEETVFMVNHQSTSDTTLVMTALFAKNLVSGQVLWVMDKIFKYTNFGLVSMCRGDFFIAQGKSTRLGQLEQFKKHLIDVYLPRKKKWIVLFPEGGFLRKRLESSQAYGKKNGYPILNHSTLPRTGAIKVIIDTIGAVDIDQAKLLESHARPLKWIIDVTLGYPEGKALDAHGCAIGWHPPTDCYLHYRAYPVSEIPRDLEGLTKWMYERYAEKDKMLENFYKSGKFEEPADAPKRVLPRCREGLLDVDIIQIIMFHVFYLVSTYVHYVYILCPILSFIGL